MEALPSKVRELVLDAYAAGMKTKQVAQRFKVSRSCARRVKQCERETGRRVARVQAKHGPDPKLGADGRGRLAAIVKRTPDATLAELKRELGLPVSISTIDRALRALRLTLKKSRPAPRSKTGRT